MWAGHPRQGAPARRRAASISGGSRLGRLTGLEIARVRLPRLDVSISPRERTSGAAAVASVAVAAAGRRGGPRERETAASRLAVCKRAARPATAGSSCGPGRVRRSAAPTRIPPRAAAGPPVPRRRLGRAARAELKSRVARGTRKPGGVAPGGRRDCEPCLLPAKQVP